MIDNRQIEIYIYLIHILSQEVGQLLIPSIVRHALVVSSTGEGKSQEKGKNIAVSSGDNLA